MCRQEKDWHTNKTLKKAWDTVQINISSRNGEAKQLQQEQSKAVRGLNKAQKQYEELERQHKAFVEKQQYYLAQMNWLKERFPNGVYEDVIGLCKAASLAEIEEQDWSLNPGRYVGVVIEEDGLTEEEFLQDERKAWGAESTERKSGKFGRNYKSKFSFSSMKDWKLFTLKEITTKIGSGSTPTGGKEAYYESGITLIRSLNIYDFAFEYKDLAFINDLQAKKLDGVTVEKNDILLNITGASVGRCTIVPKDLLPARVNQHVSIIRCDTSKTDAKFLLYCINSSSYKDALMSIADSGATREDLTKVDIEKFQVLLPPLSIRQRIASILSAYDELIEVNNQRIKLLEDTASQLYKEWFVRMRFPGYKKAKFEKGIPVDWKIKPIGKVIDYHIGGGWGNEKKTNEFPVSGYVIRGTDIPRIRRGEINKEVFRFHKFSNIKSRELTEADIIFERPEAVRVNSWEEPVL